MNATLRGPAFTHGILLCTGMVFLAYILGSNLGFAVDAYKKHERTVIVKGLSERTYEADVVIWPIQFSVANNELEGLYNAIDENKSIIKSYLMDYDISETDITYSETAINDKTVNNYTNQKPQFRYSAFQVVTVYSKNIASVQKAINHLSELGRKGIVFSKPEFNNALSTKYLFTRLNNVKPEMIEEATRNARGVAEKFALDSNSRIGKIKSARQGQFSITNRDQNNPHIKLVRVVSTIEYYLSD